MGKTHPLFHKFKSVVGYSVAIIVIVSALAVSGLRFILTTANLYQEEVEQLASSLLEQPVKIGQMDAKLSGLIPTIIFHNVELLSDKTKKTLFSLSRIDVGLSIDDLIWQQKITPAQLTVRGMNLHITRTVEGHLKVKGVDLDGLAKSEKDETNSLLERWVAQKGEIALEDSTFTWKDEQNAGLTWFFEDVNFLLKGASQRYQLLLSGKLPDILGDKINLAIDIDGNITEPKDWDLKAFIDSEKINLKPFRRYIKNSSFELLDGNAGLKLWLDWKNEAVNKLSGDIKLYDFSYVTNKKKRVNLNFVSAVFDSYRGDNDLWNISVDKFNYGSKKFIDESTFSLAFKYKNKKIETFHIKANHIKINELSKVITDNHVLSDKNEKYIKQLDPKGDIRNIYMVWRNNQLYKVKADFSHVGVNAWRHIPKVKLISGNIKYEENKGFVTLSSQNSVLGFPGLFRNDFDLDNLSANVSFSNTDAGIVINTNDLLTENSDVSAVTSARIWLPKSDASPYLDLQTYVSDGDIEKISQFLPVSIMNKSLVKWLDKSLLAGKVEKATILFNGEMRDFPFNKKEGEFSVAVKTSGLTMNFRKDWPQVTNAKIDGIFTGQGMDLQVLSAVSGGNVIHNSSVKIVSFRQPAVELDLAASGSSYNAVQYIVNSPILPKAKKTVDSMRVTGNADVKVKVYIPLNNKNRKKQKLSYSGHITLNDSSLFMLQDKLDIKNISGSILFSDKKVGSKRLMASIFGEKMKMSLSSSVKDKKISLNVQGKMNPGVILSRFDIPGAKAITGESHFSSVMSFPVNGNKNQYPILRVSGDLSGVKSTLPDQFNKKSKKRQNFNFSTSFTGDDKFKMGFSFGKRSSAILELVKSNNELYLNKGAVSFSDKKAILPEKNILYIDGEINKLSVSKWNHALELNKTNGTSRFFRKPMVINLSRLKIVTGEKNKELAASRPLNIPSFEGIINKLYFDDMFLGRLDFKVTAKNNGLHFDEIILSEKNMKLFSSGGWYYAKGKHKTNLNITLSSNDFGGMLTGFGFSAVIAKGTAEAIGKLNWNAAPAQFSFKGLNGNIQLKIKNGNIIEAEAGAGRLLGLFSLSALPRKLFGDFSDTFKSGFNFDTANGEIKIDNGDAYTEGFLVKSPVAEVTVSGRTGLAARDYDNVINVIPEVGGGIAGVAALLINLPAGIGLWLVDKLTGEKINKVSTRIYRVSGSWDKPVIEDIDKDKK